jgi:hypothetical protein
MTTYAYTTILPPGSVQGSKNLIRPVRGGVPFSPSCSGTRGAAADLDAIRLDRAGVRLRYQKPFSGGLRSTSTFQRKKA